MKRFLVVCAAATLCCSLVSAQEAEDTGRGAELSIVPRLDAGVFRSVEDKSTSFNFGNTSLYTFFEGNISENWSFALSNHWVASDWGANDIAWGILAPTKDLYRLSRPFGGEAFNNFVDWAYVTYAPGSFEFTLGKMPMIVGGFEFEENDVDVHPIATSIFWNSFTVYQPAFSASWTTPSEMTTLTLQVSADQFNRRPAYGLKWTGEYGPFSPNWSVVLVSPLDEEDPASTSIYPIISIGNRLTFGSFSLTADFINRCGDPNYYTTDLKGHTLLSTFAYAPSEQLNMAVRCAWNHVRSWIPGVDDENFLTTSLQANWYPIEDDDMFRIQFCAGMMDKDPFAVLGTTWNFGFKLW